MGQACFGPGMLKATYGTGCFAVLNTGRERVTSANRLLTTIAYRLDGVTTYALEGAIFIADVHHLVQPVHAGVGATGADRAHRLVGKGRQRLLEHVLHGAAVGLRLPAVIGLAAVAEPQH